MNAFGLMEGSTDGKRGPIDTKLAINDADPALIQKVLTHCHAICKETSNL